MQDKVLIIEDTRSFALLLQKLLLDDSKVETDIAYSMQEAKELIEKNSSQYFASVVDLNLPDAPNGEATDLVVAANIPALVFTGTDDQSLKEELWDRGISDYASKTGAHSLEYICWIVNRIRNNSHVEILVVDDSIVARKSMGKLLKTQRYKVHAARSGTEALQIMEANPNISVAIIDCFMDGMDGFQLSSLLRDKYSRESLEIIGISSQGGRALSAQFIKAGANDFLIKPFIPEEFLCRINHATERVETFNKLKELNHVKNRLLGTAAHDIRGPVGAMQTAADYILRRDPPVEKQQSLLKMISKSSSGLLELLADLLDMSALDSGELVLNLSEENLVEMINDRCSLYKSEAENKDIKIEIDLPQQALLNCDAVKMRQVVDNVLTNAIKYSPTGGEIEVQLVCSEKFVEFSVSDSGPGIPEDEQKDLFEPFKTLSTKTTGGEKATGLGLTIAKNVVVAHKGDISYGDSAFGGARFNIRLPR